MKRVHSLGPAALILGAVIGFSFLPTQARAIAIFFDPAAINPFILSPGDQITVDLRLDTQGETAVTSVFVSVQVDPSVLGFVSGTSLGSILFNFDTFEGLQRISQPFTMGGDPSGLVRAASFATLEPTGTGVAASDQLLATLTFAIVGPGLPTMSTLFAPGDDLTVNGVSVKDSVTLGSLVLTPEPGTALLLGLGLGLAGLGASRRRD